MGSLILIWGWFGLAMFGAWLGSIYGNATAGFILTLCFGPLGIVIVLLLPPANHIKICPSCRRPMGEYLRTCRACGADIKSRVRIRSAVIEDREPDLTDYLDRLED